jgi:hypothetical protein
MTALFANSVLLRDFLAQDADAPSSDSIKKDSFAVLLPDALVDFGEDSRHRSAPIHGGADASPLFF